MSHGEGQIRRTTPDAGADPIAALLRIEEARAANPIPRPALSERLLARCIDLLIYGAVIVGATLVIGGLTFGGNQSDVDTNSDIAEFELAVH